MPQLREIGYSEKVIVYLNVSNNEAEKYCSAISAINLQFTWAIFKPAPMLTEFKIVCEGAEDIWKLYNEVETL